MSPVSTTIPPVADAVPDGRRARRERNRDAVISALLSLHDEGDLAPSVDAIAERAGLSARSLFRYFDDADDLARTAIARQQERLAPIFAREVDTGGSRAERIRHAVEHRVDLLVAMGNVGKVARMRAPLQPAIAAELRRVRGEMRELLRRALAPDLAGLPAGEARLVLASLDVACSFEAFDLLRNDHGLTDAQATEQLVRTVEALLP